jgi:hypothetical protein
MRLSQAFFLLLLLFCCSISAMSQMDKIKMQKTQPVKVTSRFKLGFCYSLQNTFMPNKDEENTSGLGPTWKQGNMYGITSGAIFEGDKFSLDFGVLYSTQGINYSNPTPFYSPITLKYIKIPITLSYAPFREYHIPLVFTGGFQMSNLVYANVDMPNGWYLPGNGVMWFNSTLFDVVWGVGMDIPVSKKIYFDIKVRGDYSLGDPDNIHQEYMYGSHWKSDRSPTHNITVGALFGLEYHF